MVGVDGLDSKLKLLNDAVLEADRTFQAREESQPLASDMTVRVHGPEQNSDDLKALQDSLSQSKPLSLICASSQPDGSFWDSA